MAAANDAVARELKAMVDPVNYAESADDRPQLEAVPASNGRDRAASEYSPPCGEAKEPLEQNSEQISVWQHIVEDINCVFDRDPAARNRWEVVFTYPGFHALLMYRLAHWMCGQRWRFLARFVSFISRGGDAD